MPYLFQKRGIRVIYKGSIFVQKSIAVNPQRICKCHRYIVLNGVSVILIQNQCRGHNANLFCQFPCGETLECPVILQILARCGAFFIGFVVKGQMNHDFAFRIEVNPCVIEITIGKAKWYLEGRFDRDVSVQETADFVGLSRSQLYRVMMEQLGCSPRRLLAEIRIRHAQQLLKTTSLTMEEIARRIGLCTGAQFGTLFRSMQGISPGKYRQLEREKEAAPQRLER